MNRFDEFVNEVADLKLAEIISRAQREAISIDRLLSVRSRQKQVPGESEYRTMLGGLLCLLRLGRKPAGITDGDVPRMRPVIERLVKSGELPVETLAVLS